MELKGYYYYSINDPKKEAIDRVAAMSRLDALDYFAERKQLDEFAFIKLYNVEEIDETTQPK